MIVLPSAMPAVADGVIDTLIAARHYIFLVYLVTTSLLVWIAGSLDRRRVAPKTGHHASGAWPALDVRPSPVP